MPLMETYEESVHVLNFMIDRAKASDTARDLGGPCSEISKLYRILAICELLLGADTDGFFHHLIRSAQTRLVFLKKCREENDYGNPYYLASLYEPLLDAIVSNQFALARKIAELSPTYWREGEEYIEDFQYSKLLHGYFQPSPGLSQTGNLSEFEVALDGARDPRLGIHKAILEKDQAQFTESFSEFLDMHEEQHEKEKGSTASHDAGFLPNHHVCVEALAILRLAGNAGLLTESEYQFCPGLARMEKYGSFAPGPYPGIPVE